MKQSLITSGPRAFRPAKHGHSPRQSLASSYTIYITAGTMFQMTMIGHMLISKAVVSSTIATTRMCPICGTFKKSGRVSCCAPGGAWYQKCGGTGSRSVEHTWIEGTEACERKFEATCMLVDVFQ